MFLGYDYIIKYSNYNPDFKIHIWLYSCLIYLFSHGGMTDEQLHIKIQKHKQTEEALQLKICFLYFLKPKP